MLSSVGIGCVGVELKVTKPPVSRDRKPIARRSQNGEALLSTYLCSQSGSILAKIVLSMRFRPCLLWRPSINLW